MPSGHSLNIRTAELSAGGRPSEDRIFVTPNAVIVLDGASQALKLERTGAWIAEELGQRLAAGLRADPGQPLAPLLEHCIKDLVDTFELVPGEAPSATVAIVRLDGDALDVLVLCDSPVIVLDKDGTVLQIRDDRLAATVQAIGRPAGLTDMSDPRWVAAATAFEKLRNHPDGFWVASASPEAARHAVERRIPVSTVDTVLALTDGVSAGVDDYGLPSTWHEAIAIARAAPDELLSLIHEAEAGDPDAARWSRTKRHDDKALAVIRPQLRDRLSKRAMDGTF